MIYREYKFESYNFEKILMSMFSVKNLELIHETLTEKYEKFQVDTDQNSEIHKIFYSNMEKDFIVEYENFIKKEVLPLYDCEILFQKFPTFRVSLPDNVAVGGYHKDSDYNHSKLEVNYFLPFTRSFDTNAIWYEEEKEKYVPMQCEKGQFVEWDGANTMHGNKTNDTSLSRVSIDFRIIKYDDYLKSKNKKSSITNNVKFDIGNYWKRIHRN
jgi:hypothetical protein